MAPPEAARLAAETKARRISDSTLIGLMVSTILGGIGFLLYAVRKERRANQLKSEFISNVSHELKTPLSLIRMFGELLALGKVKSAETGREYAEIITRESERLSRLIDNVLDFSRIERGKASYDFQSGDLADVVARAVDVYRLRFEREGVQLKMEIEPDLPETLFDESALTLVLLNLLDNAVKYGGEEKRVEVSVRREIARLRLTVRDHGPGIPHDEQRRIFDRFYRGPSVRAHHARGSGIGLSLVKHIAEAHGGRVTVDSEPGLGSSFHVTLPILERPSPPTQEAA
jgi:two-component system phosphate regulon sensor histidine kinase PhoR